MQKKVLKKNLEKIKNRVKNKAQIIAVTKYVDVKVIKDLYDFGVRDFGENRVESLKGKSKELSYLKDIRWHFIGKIQSKKIKNITEIDNLFAIHSVDRLKVLKILNDLNYKNFIFIQYNISNEVQKSGFNSREELNEAISFCKSKDLKLKGLMGMAKSTQDHSMIDKSFKYLKLLRDELDSELELSMGMSSDFEMALNNDASWLRIGSSLYKNLD